MLAGTKNCACGIARGGSSLDERLKDYDESGDSMDYIYDGDNVPVDYLFLINFE